MLEDPAGVAAAESHLAGADLEGLSASEVEEEMDHG